ncbi:MAG TPA: Holliday junction resolvase RuvX [Candidatus Xenobia bacterium]|nr:Holliday junction resolvase RuvX [Candidatus Xenobia bacterium]
MKKHPRILGIDFGGKFIGLAVSDPLGVTVRGLPTLKRANKRADLDHLRELVQALGVERVVVGHPVHLRGHAGERAREAERFAAWLRRELGLPVELYDERLTSAEAENLLRERGQRAPRTRQSRTQRVETVNRLAAAVLLQSYLDDRRAPPTAAE